MSVSSTAYDMSTPLLRRRSFIAARSSLSHPAPARGRHSGSPAAQHARRQAAHRQARCHGRSLLDALDAKATLALDAVRQRLILG